MALYLAAAEPKRLATYAGGHVMALPIIGHDQRAWLTEQLELPAAKR